MHTRYIKDVDKREKIVAGGREMESARKDEKKRLDLVYVYFIAFVIWPFWKSPAGFSSCVLVSLTRIIYGHGRDTKRRQAFIHGSVFFIISSVKNENEPEKITIG